jgi:hypothetical protein
MANNIFKKKNLSNFILNKFKSSAFFFSYLLSNNDSFSSNIPIIYLLDKIYYHGKYKY